MRELEFKKFPVVATVLAALTVLLAVVAITTSLAVDTYEFVGAVFLGLVLLVAAVLFVAGLTTAKVGLLKVISVMSSVGVIITNFVLTIAKFGTRETVLFALVLLMLIVSVLSYIYFLTSGRNKRIKVMYLVTIIVLVTLTFAYSLVYMLDDLTQYQAGNETYAHYPYYLLLFGYGVLVAVPLAIRYSLTPKEPKQEEQEEKIEESVDAF